MHISNEWWSQPAHVPKPSAWLSVGVSVYRLSFHRSDISCYRCLVDEHRRLEDNVTDHIRFEWEHSTIETTMLDHVNIWIVIIIHNYWIFIQQFVSYLIFWRINLPLKKTFVSSYFLINLSETFWCDAEFMALTTTTTTATEHVDMFSVSIFVCKSGAVCVRV